MTNVVTGYPESSSHERGGFSNSSETLQTFPEGQIRVGITARALDLLTEAITLPFSVQDHTAPTLNPVTSSLRPTDSKVEFVESGLFGKDSHYDNNGGQRDQRVAPTGLATPVLQSVSQEVIDEVTNPTDTLAGDDEESRKQLIREHIKKIHASTQEPADLSSYYNPN